jgi:flagellar biosynthesis/type III secretory pathway protein FliH
MKTREEIDSFIYDLEEHSQEFIINYIMEIQNNAYESGEKDGYERGYGDGHAVGYSDGYKDAEKDLLTHKGFRSSEQAVERHVID